MGGRIPCVCIFLMVCVSSYGSIINAPGVFELLKQGLTEYSISGKQPSYLPYTLMSYPLQNILRHQQDLEATNNTEICILCEILVNALILERRNGMTDVELGAEALYFCNLLQIENDRVCKGGIDITLGIFTYMVDNNEKLTGERVCGLLLHNMNCRGGSLFEWSVDIPEGNTVSRVKASGTKTFNILHISDIHIDPYYTPGKTNNCKEPLCCQFDQDDGANEAESCGYWGDYTDADTPIQTLNAAMDKIVAHNFDFVYYTGDIVSHRMWSTSVENNTRDIIQISNIFHDRFDVPVYAALGNHEAHPFNVYTTPDETDPTLSTQWLFDLTASKWGDWLSEEAKAMILKGGFYTVSPKNGFKVIVLNSNVCYTGNWWLIYEDKDPYGQLEWLVEVLVAAEEKEEKVHILMHVPTGSSECLRVWSREYNRIIERFANTIVGHFNGHTHRDEVLVYYNSSDITQAINVAWNGASITTYSLGNPSYKLLEIDAETFDVWDFEEWTMDLETANLDAKNPPAWYKLYSFREAYNVDSLDPSEIDLLLQRMTKDHSLIDQYYTFKFRNSTYPNTNPCDETCQKKILCDITTAVPTHTDQCERFSRLYDENK
ncbi:hypothetical protein NQ317_006167 [Molorchus minor]|uniref:Sphingomyelin phosphodiesterase n=1 Tax=Molorchus minor TaxID=1323400 RepID=A0ABQ9J8F2_9CUCU|nr:hypothetical protein NQ317_006167 [Molorchus minor]